MFHVEASKLVLKTLGEVSEDAVSQRVLRKTASLR